MKTIDPKLLPVVVVPKMTLTMSHLKTPNQLFFQLFGPLANAMAQALPRVDESLPKNNFEIKVTGNSQAIKKK